MQWLPWAVALAGLGGSLLASGFEQWLSVALLLVALRLLWLAGQTLSTPSEGRIMLALAFLLILIQAGFLGGWWLIPANLTWLTLQWRARFAGRSSAAEIAS